RHPTAPAYYSSLAHTHFCLALYWGDRGLPKQAVEHYDAARVILEALVKQQPSATRYRMSLAYIRHNLGMLHAQARRFKEAEQAFQEALKIKKPLAEANPSPKYQADLALTYQNLGIVCLQTRRLKEAAEHYEAAANLFEVVRDVPRYR